MILTNNYYLLYYSNLVVNEITCFAFFLINRELNKNLYFINHFLAYSDDSEKDVKGVCLDLNVLIELKAHIGYRDVFSEGFCIASSTWSFSLVSNGTPDFHRFQNYSILSHRICLLIISLKRVVVLELYATIHSSMNISLARNFI